MTLSTQGLVLHTTKYAETSIIAKIFTREAGLRSYIVKGIRSAKGATKQNMLQPLSLLEMTVYNNPKKQLQYIKEMRLISSSLAPKPAVTMALFFFMDEVLYKSLKEEDLNPSLFDYVVEVMVSLSDLDNTANHDNASYTASLPIRFLIHTARHLGIEPMDNYSLQEPLFNMNEGRFQAPPSWKEKRPHSDADYFLDASESSLIHHCLYSCHNHSPMPNLSAVQRRNTLYNLLEYYHIHLDDFKNFKSHEVLHSVLR